MTRREELLALADRVEAASEQEQHEMLEAAFVAVHGPKPARVHGGGAELSAWLLLHNPFFVMLKAKAWESAAMSLVPEGWLSEWGYHFSLEVDYENRGLWNACFYQLGDGGDTIIATAVTLALALIAAALRALAEAEQ